MAEGRTILQLDIAALPLTGAEWIPIVQNGFTRRVRLRDLLLAGFSGSDIRTLVLTITQNGQTSFQLPTDVSEVEQVQVNGQSLSPTNYAYSAPTLTIIDLPYQLETDDDLIVFYSAQPVATQP